MGPGDKGARPLTFPMFQGSTSSRDSGTSHFRLRRVCGRLWASGMRVRGTRGVMRRGRSRGKNGAPVPAAYPTCRTWIR